MLYWTAARYGEQAATAQRAAALAQALGDDREVAWTESLRGLALLMLGRLEQSVSLLEAALPGTEERGDGDTLRWFVVHLGEAYACLGHFDRFLLHMARARELAELMGNPISRSYVCYWLGLHAFYTGEWQHARACYEEGRAVALTVEVGAEQGVAAGYSLLGLGQLCSAQGENELGGRYLDDALAFAWRGLPARLLRPVQGCLAEREILAGRPFEAIERLEPLLDALEGRVGIDATPLLPLLAWAYLEVGIVELAEEITRESIHRCRCEHHQLALLGALRIDALLAIRHERWDESAAALDEALALARTMPYPYAEAKALSVYGQLHAANDRADLARRQWEAALVILGRLGERLYAERIEHMLTTLPRA